VGETLDEVYTLLFGASLVVAPACRSSQRRGDDASRPVGDRRAWAGVLLGTLGPATEGTMIAGINAFVMLANAAKNPFLSGMSVPHDCNNASQQGSSS
jgi:hypothetical protein